MSDHIIADLLIKDRSGIEAVRGGLRGVSCGYDATYRQLSPGRATQDTIRGNHVAIVREGRGGKTCYIGDEIMADAPSAEVTVKAGLFDKMAAFFAEPKEVAPAATFDEAGLLAKIGTLIDTKVAPLTAEIEALKPKGDGGSAGATTDAATLDALNVKIAAFMPDAEVLKPGIAKPAATLDAVTAFQREVLTAALSGDHRDTVKTVVRGDVATMDAATLDAMVPAAAGIVRVLNDAANKVQPINGTFDQATRDRTAETQTMAIKHWGASAGQVHA